MVAKPGETVTNPAADRGPQIPQPLRDLPPVLDCQDDANPFSPAPFMLSLPQPPLTAVSLFEYRITVFNAWQTWPASVNGVPNYVVDTLPIPGIVYLQYPPPAYQYRLTYTCGYTTLPPELKLMLLQYIAWKNENRLGEDKSHELSNIFLGRKSWVL